MARMISLHTLFTLGLLLAGTVHAKSKVHEKPNFLRQMQTECDCSDYNDDVCLGYDYNGEGGSALPSNFEQCGEVCCNCSCSAVTVELCVACLDAGACNSFLTSCAEECCILQDAPAPAPQKWGGWGGSSGSWGGSSGGGGPKPPSKPKPAPKPKGGKYKSGGGGKKGKKSKYSSGGGGYYSSSWSGSTGTPDHSGGSYGGGRVAGGGAGGRVDAGGSVSAAAVGGSGRAEGTGTETERETEIEPENEVTVRSSSASVAGASVSSTAATDSSMMTQKIFGMSRTVFFCASLLAISVFVVLAVGLTHRNTAREEVDSSFQEMPNMRKADEQYVRSA